MTPTPGTPAPQALPEAPSHGPSYAPSRVAFLLGGYFLAFAAGLALVDRSWAGYPRFTDITYLPFRVAACFLIWRAAKATTDPAVATGWRLLTWAQVCAIAGNLTWAYSDLAGAEVASPAYMTWSVPHNALTLLGLWTIMRSRRGVQERLSDWVDAGILVVAGGSLAWFFQAAKVAEIESRDVTWVSLFLADSASNFAMVFFAAAVRFRSPPGVSRAAMTRLTVAYGLLALADLAFEAQTAADTYRTGSWLDLAYAASVIVIALAADRQRRNPHGDGTAVRSVVAGDFVVLGAALLALVTLIGLVTAPAISVRAVGGTVVGIAILALLVLWRHRLARAEIELLVAKRIQLERQLWQAQKMETIGRLTSGIAHDFNNILASISAHAQLLTESVSSADRGDAEAIEFAAQRAAALTRRLLAFGSASTVEPTPVVIGTVVASLEPLLRRLLPADVTITVSPPDEELEVVLADGQLEQIVLNLVINARDAMPFGGQLDISVGRSTRVPDDAEGDLIVRTAPFAEIVVTDTGSGMDADTRSHLFEPFFTTKPKEQGTGLGLSTVAGIVNASGGRIIVESAHGRGTTMRVLLPLAPPRSTPATAPPAAVTPAPGMTVLVVDDEEAIRSAISRFFVRLGFRVIQAADGAAALEPDLVPGGVLDLLITDVRMPRMSGVELAHRLRRASPRLPVVFITGFANPELGPLAAGGSAPTLVIRKPFDLSDLAARARRLLDEARAAVPGASSPAA